jgi:hypothetical protein
MSRTRADAPKQRQSSSGSERQVSSQRVTPSILMPPFRRGRRRPKAGSLALQAIIASLRQGQFDTVLGPIDFDDKGDLTVQNPVWYVWRDGTYVPLE